MLVCAGSCVCSSNGLHSITTVFRGVAHIRRLENVCAAAESTASASQDGLGGSEQLLDDRTQAGPGPHLASCSAACGIVQGMAGAGDKATTAAVGDCLVTTRWLGFHRIWQGSGEVFDTVDLFLPDMQLRTQARPPLASCS